MIDHDQLFKELLSNFFSEFIELFLPQVAEYLEPAPIIFLQQEFYTDVLSGEQRVIDLLAQVKYRGQDTCFLIHIEHQSSTEADFAQRMFHYFAYIHQRHGLPVYPIALFSFDAPQRTEPDRYKVEFPDRKILDFNFVRIQLNRLNWRSFLQQRNPIAAALMAKMKIQPKDRPKVKAECLRLLATLQLNPARMQIISGFVDTYLRLNAQEEQVFQAEIGKMGLLEEEQVMRIVTSWMEKGATDVVLRQLNRRLGNLDPRLEERIRRLSYEQLENLGEALLDFSSEADLVSWLSGSST
ncbi:MAG: DUF4351 domain-containing protein [Elainella sp. C42_A2020_010]|nr:DUF4351 domain-containing protein [Elainella sp. C42_A2020_010]